MSHPSSGRPNSGARVCTIIAFVCAVIAVLFVPVLFGLIAVVLGVVAGFLGDRPLGWYAAAAGVGGAILGLVLAAAVVSAG
ncbi:hypothetical protein [Actinoplanes derwentensis]|uniref:DUF4190 domain-containing protein n=1 Tax=Actinoplanes derwentensis TaxID=113562 RepID=A0A1H1ZDC0_9ACTN|nr:hypothetical protein [Actinoplanes derwentensis]GID82383.1 hypothetical protein Ade03nite_13070 [Actinoplanes derwentensis]SDT31775.1 hypothetical protein SAMN04489716_3266 [Actinoplanes derwentensis]